MEQNINGLQVTQQHYFVVLLGSVVVDAIAVDSFNAVY